MCVIGLLLREMLRACIRGSGMLVVDAAQPVVRGVFLLPVHWHTDLDVWSWAVCA